ncbi:Alpha/Beta hydrolase protein [Phakopsora pachyrhizi]|uniref:Alpha/Beta hydrolase protein n=1 Tax=Phakopsora pachyrhizi TaxID=170000 RepID=A0AAV0B804_PHAPC|nr:Alpha/Beta hydrolase protein [Phakopsora pachyrhizi]
MVKSSFFLALLPFLLNYTYATVTPSITRRANEPWLNLPNTPSLPGKPAGKTVDVNGAKLWYAEFGNVQSKEVPLILLHGGFGNSDYYGSLIPLVNQTRRIITMDTRGQGRSTMDAQKLTFELYASDITGLLKNLGISKAAFVGWSHMGVGTIATMLGSQTASFVDRALLYGAYSNVQANNESYSGTQIYKTFIERAAAEYKHYQPNGDLETLSKALVMI